MKKTYLLLTLALAAVVITVMASYGWRWQPSLNAQIPSYTMRFGEMDTVSGIWSLIPFREYQQISLKKMSRDEATRIYVANSMKDRGYEGAIALSFYGRVVDENGQPVPKAFVAFEWNTNNVPGGTAADDTLSDGNGLFSLTGQHGKVLEVRTEKEGYYTVDGGKGALAFEYANPSSPYWYEPDPQSPVIFHLRKKGQGAKLFSKSFNVPLNDDHPQDRVNLIQGFIKPDGTLIITTDKSKFLPGAQPFPWTVSLSMTEGGLIETPDQFPFLAPESGYTSTATTDMTNTDRNVWRGGVTKTYYFYLPSTNTYGRLTIDTSATLPFVSLNYVYNQKPGQRILEPLSN